jgi:hypothetical protein
MSFLYTPDELEEGLTAAAKGRVPRKRGLFGWVLFVTLAASLLVLLQRPRVQPTASTGAPDAPKRVIDVWITLVPSTLAAVIIGTLMILGIASGDAAKRRPLAQRGKYIRRCMNAAVMVCVVSVMAAMWLLINEPEISWQPSAVALTMLAFAPWLLLLVLLIGWGRRAGRRASRRAFDTRPSIRRERTVELDDGGLRYDDGMTRYSSKWARYQRAIETARTFALIDENDEVTVLPKRAMAGGDADVQKARTLINNHVAECDFLIKAGGFEVAPMPVLPATPPRGNG